MRAADSSVEIDEARDDAAVLLHAIEPGIHVLENPLLVLRLAREQIRVQRQRRRDQIQKVIADDVGVFLVVGEELFERRLAVLRFERLDVERIAHPVERRRFSKHRPAAAVLHAADDLVRGIVVGRFRVLAHVEAGESARALLIFGVGRNRQAHAVEELQPFAVVHPVGLNDELLVVHALARDGDVGRPRLGVLREQTFVALRKHREDVVARAERMQFGPVIEILERIIRAVVRAPADEALETSAVVEVFPVELPARRHVVGEEPPLELRPARRIHARIDADRLVLCARCSCEQPAADGDDGCTVMHIWSFAGVSRSAGLFRLR